MTKKFSSKKFLLHMKTNCLSDGNVNKTPSLMTLTKVVEDLMSFDLKQETSFCLAVIQS